jgi:hypothetical protein
MLVRWREEWLLRFHIVREMAASVVWCSVVWGGGGGRCKIFERGSICGIATYIATVAAHARDDSSAPVHVDRMHLGVRGHARENADLEQELLQIA